MLHKQESTFKPTTHQMRIYQNVLTIAFTIAVKPELNKIIFKKQIIT